MRDGDKLKGVSLVRRGEYTHCDILELGLYNPLY